LACSRIPLATYGAGGQQLIGQSSVLHLDVDLRSGGHQVRRARHKTYSKKQLDLFGVGPLFLILPKSKYQTIGDTNFFHLPYVLVTCQIIRFAK